MEIRSYKQVNSTQDLARNLGPTDRIVAFIAESQTSGKGKAGAKWLSFQNAFAATICYPYNIKLLQQVQISVPIVLAKMFEVLEPQNEFTISFPNDIHKNGRKLCGILIEANQYHIIVGIGFNVLHAEDPFIALDTDIQKHYFLQNFHLLLRNKLINISKQELLTQYYKRLLQKNCKLLDNGTVYQIIGIELPGVLILKDLIDGAIKHHENASIKEKIISVPSQNDTV